MQKGLSAPVLIVLLSVIGAVILGYVGLRNDSTRKINEVKGVSTENPASGFSVNVISDGTWDFYQYLCKDRGECTKSAISGYKESTVSGGETDGHEIVVNTSEGMDNYKYIKLFVKPSWGSTSSSFTSSPGYLNTKIEKVLLSDGQDTQVECLLIPVDSLTDSFQEKLTIFKSN